jgi:hypothetical protein
VEEVHDRDQSKGIEIFLEGLGVDGLLLNKEDLPN